MLETPWYAQDLIRGHISWLHPAWTRPERDFDAKRWIDQFERAGFKSFVFYAKFLDFSNVAVGNPAVCKILAGSVDIGQ